MIASLAELAELAGVLAETGAGEGTVDPVGAAEAR